MTKMLGESLNGNELENTRYWGQDENDEYHCFEYSHNSQALGVVRGVLFSGRKRIVFDPLTSKWIGQLMYDTPEIEFKRIAELGIKVGQSHRFPTRRIRSEHREKLWDKLTLWPDCSDTEGNNICTLDRKLRCTVPEPMTVDFREASAFPMNAKISQVEMLWLVCSL